MAGGKGLTMRMALGVEYAGNAFEGWQTQPHGRTVQDALEAALAAIAGVRVATVCAGRTDTGVHASCQVVHFEAPVSRPLTAWVRGVNSHLPSGVVVRWAVPVADDFHARFSARARRYRYLLHNAPVRPALLAGRVGWYHVPLDAAAMQQAAGVLLGEHDFSSFRAAECQARTPVREMYQAEVRRCGEFVLFDFHANAFLQHMIRNLVGALVAVGKGAHAPDWLAEVLMARDRRVAAPTFAPDGLYLCGVDYPADCGLPQGGQLFVPPPGLVC